MEQSVRVPVAKLRKSVGSIFEGLGVPPDDAASIADALVEADLMGISSHGVSNYIELIYVPGLRKGTIQKEPHIKVERELPTMALVDGGGGMGHVIGTFAMKLAIDKAKETGVGVVAVKNSRHYGAAGYYSKMALPHDMIGVSLTNADPLVLPLAGRDARFGTNPIAVAVPTRKHPPFLLDMATSTVALGKVMLAAREGRSIPNGWAADESGRLTRDPDVAFKALRLMPLGSTYESGGHKGMGLAMVVDIVCGVLSAAGVGSSHQFGSPVGHFFAALRIDGLRDPEQFKTEMDEFLDWVQETPSSDPQVPVIYAGIKEHYARADRLKHGIPLHAKVVSYLRELSQELGLKSDLPKS